MFRTQFDRERVRSNIGSSEKVLYRAQVDKHGTVELIEAGKENLYEFIQSHRDGVDIHVLLQRFQNGDVSVFSRVQGTYGDFTQVPKTYADMLNIVIAGEQYFNALPVEERAKFGHSFEKFIASMGALTTDGVKAPETEIEKPVEKEVVPE